MGIIEALTNPGQFLALIAALVIGLSVHECAHAWMALRLGDPTAAKMGRLTLDPRKHIDPMGALVFLLVGFGWARPVPVNGWRLGREGMLQVSLAGPGSNFLLAAGSGLAARLTSTAAAGNGPAVLGFVTNFLVFFTFLNLALAVFNLLPISPLDGWSVLMGLLPEDLADRLEPYARHGAMVLLALLVLGNVANINLLGRVIWGPVRWMAGLLLGGLA